MVMAAGGICRVSGSASLPCRRARVRPRVRRSAGDDAVLAGAFGGVRCRVGAFDRTLEHLVDALNDNPGAERHTTLDAGDTLRAELQRILGDECVAVK